MVSTSSTDLTFLEFVRGKLKIQTFLFAFLFLLVVQLVLLSIFFPQHCFFPFGYCKIHNRNRQLRIEDFPLRDYDSGAVNEGSLPLCKLVPPTLKGDVKVRTEILSWSQIVSNHRNLLPGGRHKPKNCTARHRVAIIIPFRDRDMHLKLFVNNIHPFLQRQQLDYGIYVIDQAPGAPFNRAMLMNIGFIESSQLYDYQCFIFHDVDLIPEYDLNMYSCPENPRHMSVAIDKYKYRLPYTHIFGGVVAITREQFRIVNGFSNQFFGWGGEDDDMFNRIKLSNMSISRYTSEVARYKSLSHAKEKPNPARFKLIKSGMKGSYKHEGLNSLKYKRLKLDLRKLYTYVSVFIDEHDFNNHTNNTSSQQQKHKS